MKKGIVSVVALVAIVLVAFAFAPKKRTLTPNYYQGTTTAIGSLTDAMLTNQSNWNGPSVAFGNSSNLAAIEFAEDFDGADGPNDGELTLSEALAALADKYNETTHTFTSEDFTIGTGTPSRIIVRRKQ